MLVEKCASVRVDLVNANDLMTPNKDQMAMDHVYKYVGTCFDGSYVTKINKVITGDRAANFRKLDGSGTMTVMFWYDAEVYREGTIIHNAVVSDIMEESDSGEISASCVSGDHIAILAIVETPGIIDVGMTIPVRAENISYPQSVHKEINISGFLIQPYYFTPVQYCVLAPEDGDVEKARKLVSEMDSEMETILDMPRAQFFSQWLYPYKDTGDKKRKMVMNLRDVLKNDVKHELYVKIMDMCKVGSYEFVKARNNKNLTKITFNEFVTEIVDSSKEFWCDVSSLSETYGDADMFAKHESIWKYYSDAKESL